MNKERKQYLSRPDVRVYLQKYPDITAEEKHDLLNWLKSGQSPAVNDCDICDDRGYPLDFIAARRTMQDLSEQYMLCSDELKRYNPEVFDSSYELPF